MCKLSRCVLLAGVLATLTGCLFESSPPGPPPTVTAGPATAESGGAAPSAAPVQELGSQSGAPAAASSQPAVPYHNPLTPEQIADGWISLFDGHTLYGWQSNNSEVNWSVQDGAITADAGPIGLLNTTSPFADYELTCEFRMSEGGNSGIFLRTVPEPKDVKTDCYELNIADAHPQGFTTGAIVGHQATAEPITGSGDWKTFHVRAEGNHITIQLDGVQVLDYTDESSARASGLIGLQKNAGKIEFRNILLRPLAMQPLFNSTDLSGWRVVPGSKSEFTVEEGVVRVKGGQGFLETEQAFGDFLFQCDAITHGTELNSGFFFRAAPGTEQAPSNGYEVQIHNGFEGDDRTKPSNAGTGAIFRRTQARRVVSSDNEWCTITLAASGNHFAVWVNGYQVTDWTDDRPADDNPRRGRRDAAGHISLQGHDETTDLSFRGMRVAAPGN